MIRPSKKKEEPTWEVIVDTTRPSSIYVPVPGFGLEGRPKFVCAILAESIPGDIAGIVGNVDMVLE